MSVINESAVIELLTVEVAVPDTSWTLDVSELGGPDVLDDAGPDVWTPYLAKATQVSAQRGGKRTGIKTSMTVGMMSLVLLDVAGPVSNPDLKPNMPIRLKNLAGVAVFTGWTVDVNTTYSLRPNGSVVAFISVSVVDAVQVHATTQRSGVIVDGGTGWHSWVQRLRALALSSRVPITPPSASIVPNGYRLASTFYDSSLLNHFDLCCNSAGCLWWVGKDGVTRFRSPLNDPFTLPPSATYTFTDSGAGLKYANITTAFDTRNVANSLTLKQHLIAYDTEDREWKTADKDLSFVDLTSAKTWGPRGDSMDISIVDEGPYSDWDTPADRARELFDQFGQPAIQFTGLTWNAQDNPTAAAALEIYMAIGVTFAGVTKLCRIINIKHTITPTRWMIDLQLIGA